MCTLARNKYIKMLLLILVVSVVVYFVYAKFVKPTLYWRGRGVFHVKTWSRFYQVFVKRQSIMDVIKDAYDEFPEKRYYGSYQFLQPSLFVRDLDLIKLVTVKDFDHFPDHMGFSNEKADPIMGLNLFSLKGEKWRDMRSTLSPAFTGSKMKAMFALISEAAENFTGYFLKNNQEDVIELEMKDVFSKFTTDVIATCAFGIKCDSLADENNEFFKMGKVFTTVRGLAVLKGLFFVLFPKLFEFLRIPLFPASVTNFFRKIVKDTMAYREKEGIVRPDMIHLLMESKKGRLNHEKQDEETAGFATVEESSIGKTSHSKMELTDDVITAQALVFFFAGFETSSTVLSFLFYELALHPEIQAKLAKEIDEALKICGGKIDYESILKMKYLDQVVCETLRKYPPGFALNRVCVRDYKIPAKLPEERDFVLSKGCLLAIPVYGIHMDPKYFPNPTKFDPDRFSDENKLSIVPGSYMPFGSGPRNCIGSRFALLESKALIVSLLSKFNVEPIEKTPIPLELTKTFNIAVKGGMWLGLKKRRT